jgi:serine protease inhibitor
MIRKKRSSDQSLDLRINKYLVAGALILLCAFNNSCMKSMTQEEDISRNIILPVDGPSVIQANDQFAFDFFHAALQTDQTTSNKLISPLSIYLALSMLDNGAGNGTRDSIDHAIRVENISTDVLNQTSLTLIQGLPKVDQQVTLSIANSIWYNQNIQPLPAYLNLAQQYFLAKIGALNFSDPNTVNIINQWISDNTQQKITQVLNSISPADLMYLIDALYFKGNWKYAFDPKATANHSFYLSPSDSISTPFMNLHSTLNYFRNDSVQMIQLPYGAGDFNMFLLSAPGNVGLTDFAETLNPTSFNNWKSQLSPKDIQLSLPKFKYGYSIDNMEPPLTQLGMGIAFSKAADFSNMYNIPAFVNKAIHKTYIEVDETGTEAAAVTVVGVTTAVVSANQPIPVSFNHPLAYIIQDISSGTLLFIGLLTDPQIN